MNNSISKVENLFFSKIENIKIKGRNCKLQLENTIYNVDYLDYDTNKIVEFNGIYWHMKPSIYNEYDVHPHLKKTAKEIWDYENYRKSILNKYRLFNFSYLGR